MAAEWVELAKEFLKLAVRPRYSFSLWVTSLSILVVGLPNFLRLEAFRLQFGQYIGLICLVMFVVWVVEISLMIAEILKAHLAMRRAEKRTLKLLNYLNSREAHLLVVAVSKNIQTVTWREDADEVSSLVDKRLLSRVPDGSTMPHKPCTIPQFVWEEVSNPEVIEKLRALDKESMA